MEYVCNKCGKDAYFDGRCGDGLILVCGCDKKGEPQFDARAGSVDVYYNTDAKPVPKDVDYR